MSLIAVIATLNGIIVHVIMISRVLYGLAAQGNLPKILTHLNGGANRHAAAGHGDRRGRNSGFGARAVPLARVLADLTARFTLVIFAVINITLIRIKARTPEAPAGAYVAPNWAPWAGFLSCLGLLIADVGLMFGAIGSQ